MRSLPTVESADHVRSRLTARITPPDSGETFVYSQGNIISLEGLSWEVAFGGGMGRPAGYRLALSDELGTIKARLSRLERAEVRLEVLVNSELFYPHVGRVRGIQRDGRDPNRITLNVFDRLLDTDPQLPVEALTDSWAGVHPEDLDLGYPLYYGLHHRPFYHAAVTCDLSTLLGPRNVSSENHVNSVWFNFDFEVDNDIGGKNVALMEKQWGLEADSANLIFGGQPFELRDISSSDLRLFQFDGRLEEAQNPTQILAGEGPRLDYWKEGDIRALAFVPDSTGLSYNPLTRFSIEQAGGHNFLELTQIDVRVEAEPDTVVASALINAGTFVADEHIEIGPPPKQYRFIGFTGGSTTVANSPYVTQVTQVAADSAFSIFAQILTNSYTDKGFFAQYIPEDLTKRFLKVTLEIWLKARMSSAAYRRYSAFSPPVNSADVAISENPIAILDDVFSHHSGTPFVAGQSSDAQVDVQSYAFQCFFAEREPLFGNGGIVDAFGEIAAAYLWIGDSGMVNYRVYQESADATVDRIVATSHMLALSLQQDPLGVTAFDSQQASRFTVRYDYDFQTGQYRSSVAAGPATNALCQSADAAGVKGELERETRYILSDDVASYYLGHLVRIHGQGQEYAELTLPAQFFGIELADVLRVQHPMIAGSEALYRVVRVAPDYLAGTIQVRAGKILQADGS